MNRYHLGEFEELVMLTIGVLYDEAYGVAVKRELLKSSERKTTLSAVHAAMHRLEQKGYLTSRLGDSTAKRGGKRKKYFAITASGARALQGNVQLRQRLWDTIPAVALPELKFS